jgi:hypothetical protein
MEYLGEYVIPIAAIILVAAVFMSDEIAIAVHLIKRLLKRVVERN